MHRITRLCTHVHTHTHTHTHARTHTHAHTHTHTGPQQLEPTEILPLSSEDGQVRWEERVGALWTRVLHPLGFTPVAVSRLPYLCEGDLHQEVYHLDDAVIVLRKN